MVNPSQLPASPDTCVEHIDFEGVRISYSDVNRQFYRTDRAPVLLSSGWGVSIERSEPMATRLAQDGRRVVTIDSSELTATHQDRKANALTAVAKHLGLHALDVVGRSEGALNASLMAADNIDMVHSLTLFTPAGLLDAEQSKQAIENYKAKISRQPKNPSSVKRSFLYETYLARMNTAQQEAEAQVTTSIVEPLRILTSIGKPVAIIQSHGDEYFPPSDSKIAEIGGESLTHTVLADKTARHDVFATNPDMSARLLLQMIDQTY